jgi:hypothetical protein
VQGIIELCVTAAPGPLWKYDSSLTFLSAGSMPRQDKSQQAERDEIQQGTRRGHNDTIGQVKGMASVHGMEACVSLPG